MVSLVDNVYLHKVISIDKFNHDPIVLDELLHNEITILLCYIRVEFVTQWNLNFVVLQMCYSMES